MGGPLGEQATAKRTLLWIGLVHDRVWGCREPYYVKEAQLPQLRQCFSVYGVVLFDCLRSHPVLVGRYRH